MASHRLIHLAVVRKDRGVVLAAPSKQKTFNSFIFSGSPSIGHGFCWLPKVGELRFLLAAKSGVKQLIE